MKFNANGLILGLFILAACTEPADRPENQRYRDEVEDIRRHAVDALKPEKQPSLSDKLLARKSEFLINASPDKAALYDSAIAAVEATGILTQARQVGDKAPEFALRNAIGRVVTLDSLRRRGPVVLTWYRGGWCPYCNITLRHYQEHLLPKLDAYNASLVALTPELPDSSLAVKVRQQLQFEVLSDVDLGVSRLYGVSYRLPAMLRNRYDWLKHYNGNDRKLLPLAATYVIDTAGTIRYAFLDADYRNRAEPDSILRSIKNMTLPTQRPK